MATKIRWCDVKRVHPAHPSSPNPSPFGKGWTLFPSPMEMKRNENV